MEKLQDLATTLQEAGNLVVEHVRPVLNLIIDKINANSESLGDLCTEMAGLTSFQQAALLSRGDEEDELGEFKVLQDKVEDLVFDIQALELT